MTRLIYLLYLHAFVGAFVFDDRSDTSLLEPTAKTQKKVLDTVLEDREDIDYYEDNIEDYNDSDELRRDLMFETENELESDLANQIGSIDADGSNCNMPWECNRPCPIGYFRLNGMDTCHRWLECSDWSDLGQNRTYLTQGSMKRVFKTTWRGIPVILARVKRFKYFSFINNLRSLQPSIFVTQLVGACEDPAWPEVVLEYHPRGRLGNLPAVLEMTPKLASPHLLMRLLVDYAAVLSVLHHREPEGARVLCDTWSLQKISHQFLLTRDFRLLLNDVDDVSLVIPSKGRLARCNSGFYTRPELLDPDFLAPEEYSQGYFDQSVDIYKAPAVAQWILESAGSEGQVLLEQLNPIHQQCKSVMPSDRPTAEALLTEYRRIFEVARRHHEEEQFDDDQFDEEI
jgi:glycoprotein-mannosyl O6-kinase